MQFLIDLSTVILNILNLYYYIGKIHSLCLTMPIIMSENLEGFHARISIFSLTCHNMLHMLQTLLYLDQSLGLIVTLVFFQILAHMVNNCLNSENYRYYVPKLQMVNSLATSLLILLDV